VLFRSNTISPSVLANTVFDDFPQKSEKQSLVVKNYNGSYGTGNYNGSELTDVNYIVAKSNLVLAGNTLKGTPLEGMAINYASGNKFKSLDYKLLTGLFGGKKNQLSGDSRCVDAYDVSASVAGVSVLGDENRKYQYFSTNNEDALDGLLSKYFRIDFISDKRNTYPFLNFIDKNDKVYFDYDLQLKQFKGYRFILNANSYIGGGVKNNVYDITISDSSRIEDLKFNSINSREQDHFYTLTVFNPDGNIVGNNGAQSDSYYGHLWNVSSSYPNDYPYPK